MRSLTGGPTAVAGSVPLQGLSGLAGEAGDQGRNDPALEAQALEPAPLELQATIDLLARARGGDDAALNVIFQRCIRGLRRFAANRLPISARGLQDTEDIVQEAVMKALQRLDHFEARGEGSLLAYLRQAVKNRIVDEARKIRRRPVAVSLDEEHEDRGTSPLERVLDGENLERYEAALSRLKPRDQEAIVLRIELQASYEQMAVQLGMPTANSARVAVKRALFRLAREMATDTIRRTP
jgi:RNA polymerase sigma factor (sigma-70 family)